MAEFFARHYPVLNAMTEWLEMSIYENKRISYAVAECFGFNLLSSEMVHNSSMHACAKSAPRDRQRQII